MCHLRISSQTVVSWLCNNVKHLECVIIFDGNASNSNVADSMLSRCRFMYSVCFHHDVPQFNTEQAVLCTYACKTVLYLQFMCSSWQEGRSLDKICVVHCWQRVKLFSKCMLGTCVCTQATGIVTNVKNILTLQMYDNIFCIFFPVRTGSVLSNSLISVFMYEIWDGHSCDDEHRCLLRFNTVQSGRSREVAEEDQEWWRQQVPPKCWYISIWQKTAVFNVFNIWTWSTLLFGCSGVQESILLSLPELYCDHRKCAVHGSDDSAWSVPLSAHRCIPIQLKCLLLMKVIMWLPPLLIMSTEVQEWGRICSIGKYAGGGSRIGWGKCRGVQYFGLIFVATVQLY